jgi:hypothetical protein
MSSSPQDKENYDRLAVDFNVRQYCDWGSSHVASTRAT